MLVGRLARGLQLGEPGAQARRGRDVRQHPHQQVLHELEVGDRPAELLPLLRVGKRVLVGAAQPTACQATPALASRSTAAVCRNEVAFCSRLDSGTRTPSRVM